MGPCFAGGLQWCHNGSRPDVEFGLERYIEGQGGLERPKRPQKHKYRTNQGFWNSFDQNVGSSWLCDISGDPSLK